MKRSNLILSFALLASLVAALVGCNKNNTTAKTTAATPTTAQQQTTVKQPTSAVPTTTAAGCNVNHQAPFVIELANESKTRAFKEGFDVMLDDFSLQATVQSALRVLVDTELSDAPVSEDASIYKMATGVYEINTYDAITFKMRKVGEGTISLENLVLALRGDDSYDVYEICLADALNADGDSLPELTAEYQTYAISPTLSIEDDSVEYTLRGTDNASGTKVTDKILGFHLYAKGDCSQVIEISEIGLLKGTDEVILDSFNREKANAGDAKVCWWRDSKGFIVQRGVLVNGDAKYSVSAEALEANLVLNVMGDTTGASINGVSWANLKDADGNAVANAVNGAYYPLAINLEKSGITGSAFEITSTTDMYISKVYLSSLNDKAPVTEYPLIDTDSVSMFDNFNRTQIGFDGDYDKSSTNEVVTGAGLYYALSYSNGDKVAVKDGVVTFDATDLGDGYINFKEGRSAYSGQHYLVLVVKATDGATFDGFRLDAGSGTVWYNQMSSAYGLKLPAANDENYSYYDPETGFMWLIIDLKESGMAPTDYIDFYYSGTGKLLIDAAFYADEVGRNVKYIEEKIAESETYTMSGYSYSGAFTPETNLVKIEFTAAEGLTLKSFRIEGANGAIWFKDGGIVDAEGNAIDSTLSLDGLSLIIDLNASNIGVGGLTHIHAGCEDETGTYSYVIYSLTKEEAPLTDKYDIEKIAESETYTMAGYSYSGAFTPETNLVKIDFTASEGITLKSFRIEGANGAIWFKDGAIVDADGNAIDSTQSLNGLSIIIDLNASNIGVGGLTHIHAGCEDETGTYSYVIYSMAEKAVEKYDYKETVSSETYTMAGYSYSGAFTPETNLVKIEFTAAEGLTLKSFRIEGANGAIWFKDGAIVDAEGNAIDSTQSLNGLSIIIDLNASNIGVGGLTHIHAGCEDESGTYSYKIYEVTRKVIRNLDIMNSLVQDLA